MDPNNTSPERKVNKFLLNAKSLSIELIGVLICLIGVILLCVFIETHGYEIVNDYTDCLDYDEQRKCKDMVQNKKEPCFCYININITWPMDPIVTVFYELDSYYQSSSNYSKSRDDKQLSGELSLTPSQSCDPFTYVDTGEGRKPIAPCGAVADTMFNDTFTLRRGMNIVETIYTGIISEADKVRYRNPPGNLEQAFKNFSKPKNWVRNIWELDTDNPDNNGFQNEAFIAWMKTEWPRKPAWRVNHTGVYEHALPEGDYTLRVQYSYPATLYNGRRKVIISSIHYIVNTLTLGFGIALLLIGILIFIGKIIYNRKVYGQYIECDMIANKK